MLLKNRVACVPDKTMGAANTTRVRKNSTCQEMTAVLAHLRLLRIDLRRYTSSELHEGLSRNRARHPWLGENSIGCAVIEHTHDYQRPRRSCPARPSSHRSSLTPPRA